MAIGLDVKKAFRTTKHPKSVTDSPAKQFGDQIDQKARHILGLDTTYVPTRNYSASSASTNKPRGVTFSDATTAAVSVGSVTEDSSEENNYTNSSKKGSSVLLKKSRKNELQNGPLKLKTSNNSLQSFYDKSRTPLHVSQQTSDSSSRDFALRRGEPPVLSTTTPEMEHTKQLRFFSRALKKQTPQKDRLEVPTARPLTPSQRSVISTVYDVRSELADSAASQRSASQISVTRVPSPNDKVARSPARHHRTTEHTHKTKQDSVDPARAKINVRRPKVGTRNWFDDLESDSSEGEADLAEPQLHNDFAAEVKAALDDGRIDKFPPRSSSRTPIARQPRPVSVQQIQQDTERKVQELVDLADHLESASTPRKRKIGPLVKADLTKQSILNLSSSDDESEDGASLATSRRHNNRDIRASLMNASWDESRVEYGQALTLDTRESERLMRELQDTEASKPPIPPRATSRNMTYLDDRSTETLTRKDDLMACFPRTPTDSMSRATSMRESVGSEDESTISTKVMTVTRQEENLIAAMRLKKVAMKRAQAVASRQNALRALESGNSRSRAPQNAQPTYRAPTRTNNTSRAPHLPPTRDLRFARPATRTDSVTTFQTDSVPGQSVRSSIATYLSEGSQDLQAPCSVISPSTSSRPQPRPRDTFLSEMTTDSNVTASESEWTPGVRDRDSHVVVLDPFERQLLRQEIPSQYFMEAPFLGWEARANYQAAAAR